MPPFEPGARPEKTRAGEPRRVQAGLRRPARMQPLGPRALGEIFDDAAGHGAGDAQRVDKLTRGELERRADTGRRRHGAEHGGWMKAGLVQRLERDDAQPAALPDADDNAEQPRGPLGPVALAGRE